MSTKQPSLHEFFPTIKKNGSILQIKRFFYLRWTNGYSPTYQAVWLQERPSEVNFIEEVKWDKLRKSHTFYLCGYFPQDISDKFFLPAEKKYRNLHNLKSHLQKNIRKQNEGLALSTAIHFLKLDPTDFLRRLPIIMIEDVMLHESFPTLIWLLVSQSSTTFRMKKYIYEWLLGIVYLLCKNPIKDTIEYIELPNEKITEKIESFHSLSENECSILYSMYLRIAYGGMQCDMEMFQQYIERWNDRFRHSTEGEIRMDQTRIRNISFYSVKTLELDEWDVSAIDFHCNSKLIEFIQKRFPDYSSEELQTLIWKNLSSMNTRQEHSIYQPERWNPIKEHITRTQKYLLDSSF